MIKNKIHMFFKILKKSKTSRARRGKITTVHGAINTPCFMPIATKGAVKNLAPCELESLGAEIVLGNTYHLFLRPGEKLVKKAGGLHKFMNWNRPILTDSGGFQVFSLGQKGEQKTREQNFSAAELASQNARLRQSSREKFIPASFQSGVKISEKGVEFRSPIDGAKHFFTPEKSMQIQLDLGADMIMAFDECTPYPATREYALESARITYDWALRCKRYFENQKPKTKNQKYKLKIKDDHERFLFGIIQGSTFKDLRKESARQIVGLDTDGVAIGGVSVGEPREKMLEALDWVSPYLPEGKPHYLMGVGYPEQIVEAVKRGIDMFDCVIPTRNARHGALFVWSAGGRIKTKNIFKTKNFYDVIHIANKKFTRDFGMVDKTCGCYTCQNFSRAYLRHLFITKENLGLRLATIHNLAFYMELMRKIREQI